MANGDALASETWLTIFQIEVASRHDFEIWGNRRSKKRPTMLMAMINRRLFRLYMVALNERVRLHLSSSRLPLGGSETSMHHAEWLISSRSGDANAVKSLEILSNTKWTTQLLQDLLDRFPRIEQLELHSLRLFRHRATDLTLPASLMHLSLQGLELSINNFTVSIPATLSSLTIRQVKWVGDSRRPFYAPKALGLRCLELFDFSPLLRILLKISRRLQVLRVHLSCETGQFKAMSQPLPVTLESLGIEIRNEPIPRCTWEDVQGMIDALGSKHLPNLRKLHLSMREMPLGSPTSMWERLLPELLRTTDNITTLLVSSSMFVFVRPERVVDISSIVSAQNRLQRLHTFDFAPFDATKPYKLRRLDDSFSGRRHVQTELLDDSFPENSSESEDEQSVQHTRVRRQSQTRPSVPLQLLGALVQRQIKTSGGTLWAQVAAATERDDPRDTVRMILNRPLGLL